MTSVTLSSLCLDRTKRNQNILFFWMRLQLNEDARGVHFLCQDEAGMLIFDV